MEGSTLNALAEIVRDRWEWRSRILRLALAEIRAEGRGAALSWGWFFIRPLAYVACFWFAIGLGLRGGATDPGQPPYILWLSAGIVPWMLMSDALNKGVKAFRSQSAMVTTMRIPLSCITSIYTASFLLVQVVLVVLLTLVSIGFGMSIDVYLLQVPVLLLLMLVFWDMTTLMLALLGTVNTDFEQFVGIMSMPLFWVSGVIFNIDRFPIEGARLFFDLNPITFFANGYRAAFCDKTWIIADTGACIGFAVVFVITLVVTGFLYKRFAKVIPDVV